MITINEIEKEIAFYNLKYKKEGTLSRFQEMDFEGAKVQLQMAQSFLAEINDKITSLRNEYGLEKRKFVRNNIMQRISELEELIPKVEGKKQ